MVDVIPACCNLDDLATHLTGFPREVEEPPLPSPWPRGQGLARAGRVALKAPRRPASSTWRTGFIVGESPKAAMGDLRELWKDGGVLGRPAHEATVTQAEAAARSAARRRSRPWCGNSPWACPAAARGRLRRPPPPHEPVREGSALTPLLRPEAPERGKRDAAERLRGCCARRASWRPPSPTRSRWTLRDAVLELVLELLAEEEFRAARAPAWCPGLPVPTAADARPDRGG